MKKAFRFSILLSLALPVISSANCPNLSDVTFQCVTVAGKKHCQWSALSWEGFQGDVETGEHPGRFYEVFWKAPTNPAIGSTVCFYHDKHGHLVELSQIVWGGIPKPAEPLWKEGTWPGPVAADSVGKDLSGLVCNDSVQTCAFHQVPPNQALPKP